MTEFWTIEEKDVGGMLGGYPRWLDEDGWYSETDPKKFKKFATREELENSPYWQRVKNNSDYKIVQLFLKHRPISEEIRQENLKKIEELFDVIENGYSWRSFTKD